jgi:ATP phosphoribosyltransferase
VLPGADGRLRFLMLKPADVPVFVEYGAADLGIAGLDVVREADRDVYEPLHLPFGYCRLVIAGRADRPDRPLRLERSPRVATQFPRLTEAFFRKRGLAPEIIVMAGSVELAPLVGLADLIVDLVQTGSTLRENGLVELRVILESQAVLIANRASYRLRAGEVRKLIDALAHVVRSQRPPMDGVCEPRNTQYEIHVEPVLSQVEAKEPLCL